MGSRGYTGVIPYEESAREERRLHLWILAGAGGCAVLGALVGFEVAVAVAALATAVFLLAPSFTACLAFLLVMSLGVSQKLIVDYRVGGDQMGGPPISIIDLGMVLMVISAGYHWLLRRPRNPFPTALAWPLGLFTLAVLASAAMGLGVGMGARQVLQDLRIQLFIIVSIVGCALFITSHEQLRRLAVTFVVVGALLTLQQVGTFGTLFTDASEVNALRDVSLPTSFCVLAMMVVLVFQAQGWPLLRPGPRMALLVGCALAVLISFTRTAWAVALLSPVALLFLSRDMSPQARARMTRLLLVGGVLVVGLAVLGPLRSMTAKRVEFLEGGQIQDPATVSRLLEMEQAWNVFLANPVLGSGLGLEFDTRPSMSYVVVTIFLHNTPLYYAAKMGLVGLLLVLWLYVVGYLPLYRTAVQRGTLSAALARAVFAFFVVYGPLSAFSGYLNFAAAGPVIGFFIGTQWLLLHRREAEAHQDAAATPTH